MYYAPDREQRMVEALPAGYIEWTFESKQNEPPAASVWATDGILRNRGQHMIVCVSGRVSHVKQGGTADLFCPGIYCRDFFVHFFKEQHISEYQGGESYEQVQGF